MFVTKPIDNSTGFYLIDRSSLPPGAAIGMI
jgi:hypothetical protein